MDVSKFDLSEYSMALPTIANYLIVKCPFKTAKLYWTKTKKKGIKVSREEMYSKRLNFLFCV